MPANFSDRRTTNTREAPRTSIYLAAVLHCEGFSSPVKIRNISENGALLEGAALPGAGARVQLARGALVANGLVAWSNGSRCGLRLSGRLDVQQWRAGPANAEQQRVDEVVRMVKAGPVPMSAARFRGTALGQGVHHPARPLVEEVRRVRELLESIGGALASDSEVVARHIRALQDLDLADQVLQAVEAAIVQADPDPGPTSPGDPRSDVDEPLRRRA